MDLDIEIDPETGEISINRDHECLVDIVEATCGDEDASMYRKFFMEKLPCKIEVSGGKTTKKKTRNYRSFCG